MPELATAREKVGLDPKRLPQHIAVIMDGNGRWAKKQGVSRLRGHDAGAKSVRSIIETCRELKRVESLTLYAFSTENWNRTRTEVSGLFRLLSKHIRLELDELHEQNIRIDWVGRRDGVPAKALKDMDESSERTKDNTALRLNLALNYGARAELVDACQSLAADVKAGRMKTSDIDEAAIANRLYDPVTQEIDLLIRTGGDSRLSNFMLWQASYAEIVVTKTLWPEFRRRHLIRAIEDYQARDRRFGGRPTR